MPREVHLWTLDKLRLLELYLPGYLQATTRAVDRIYIDGFAGPGTNRLMATGEVVDGSPLIALKARAQNGSAFTRLYFIESDERTARELQESIKNLGLAGRTSVIVGDVNTELPKLVQTFNRAAPTFVFLDTEGIDPSWRTIEALAPWRTELLINFPLGMSINRNLDSLKTSAYFGTDDWRPLWSQGSRAVVDLYKGRLRSLGYVYQPENDRLIRTGGTSGQHLYWLIHASKVEAARTIWDWVLRQPDSRGQGRLNM